MISKFVTYCSKYIHFSEDKDELIITYQINDGQSIDDNLSLKEKMLVGIHLIYSFDIGTIQYTIDIYQEMVVYMVIFLMKVNISII